MAEAQALAKATATAASSTVMVDAGGSGVAGLPLLNAG